MLQWLFLYNYLSIWCVFIFYFIRLEYITRDIIDRSYTNSMFNLLRNCFPQSLHYISTNNTPHIMNSFYYLILFFSRGRLMSIYIHSDLQVIDWNNKWSFVTSKRSAYWIDVHRAEKTFPQLSVGRHIST